MLGSPFCLRARTVALLRLSRANLGDPLRVRHLEALRRLLVVEVGNGDARQPPADRALDAAQVPFLFG
jgi:hypothetical protein